jgi:ribosome-associated toxin RatA of RatAB toxin-antitoxin module
MIKKSMTFPNILTNSGMFVFLFSLMMVISCSVMANTKKETHENKEWLEYKKEDGIIGYEYDAEDSKYLETRAQAIIDAPIEVLLEILNDIPAYPQWMYECKDAVLLKQINAMKRVFYFAQGAPLGSPDREVVIEAINTEDLERGTYTTTLQAIERHPYKHPRTKNDSDRLKMAALSGTWRFQMIDRNRTQVVFTFYSDPGGFAPGFVVNPEVRKVSFLSLKGLISKAKEQKYILAARKSTTKEKIDTAIHKGKLVLDTSPSHR